MIISKKQHIDDIIVEILARKPYQIGPELVTLVRDNRKNTTKQAVYNALSFLLKNEIVSKVKGKYFLSRVWLHKIHKLFQFQHADFSGNDTIFDLLDKESISYRFPSLLSCDTYWVHIYSLLINWIPKNRPIFIWSSHEWFAIARREEEMNIVEEYKREGKRVFHSVRGKTTLDMKHKKEWTNTYVSINTGDHNNFKHNYHLNVFDDFIIEVFLNKVLAKKIDDFYQKYEKLTVTNIQLFKNIIADKYPVRMKITRNKEKALRLRKKLAKDFYIPGLDII